MVQLHQKSKSLHDITLLVTCMFLSCRISITASSTRLELKHLWRVHLVRLLLFNLSKLTSLFNLEHFLVELTSFVRPWILLGRSFLRHTGLPVTFLQLPQWVSKIKINKHVVRNVSNLDRIKHIQTFSNICCCVWWCMSLSYSHRRYFNARFGIFWHHHLCLNTLGRTKAQASTPFLG